VVRVSTRQPGTAIEEVGSTGIAAGPHKQIQETVVVVIAQNWSEATARPFVATVKPPFRRSSRADMYFR
jgi:hypothetical protein